MIFIVTGKCDTANAVRRSAKLNNSTDYNQHMTAGLLKSCRLPKAVTSIMTEEWRKRIAGDWLNVNFLCGINVRAEIINEKLENWKINISGRSEILMEISFTQINRKIEKINCKDVSLMKAVVGEMSKKCSVFDSIQRIMSII